MIMSAGSRSRVTLCVSLAAVAAFATPVATQAQEAEPGAREAERAIVVVARKREERLLDVPLSVTAITAADLEARSLATLEDLAATAPNLSLATGSGDSGAAGSSVAFIRGIGQSDYANATDPGVGLYVDGVYLGRAVGANLELPDIAQIEILRGPQGTLFGKNTMGGAINITTRAPGDTARGSAALTIGEDSRVNLDLEGDVPLGDTLGLHAALATRNQDGFVARLNGGDALGEEDSATGRARLRWTPSSTLLVDLSVDYSDIGGTSARVVPFIDPSFDLLTGLWNNVPRAAVLNAVSGGFVPVDPSLGFSTFAELAGEPIDPQFARSDLRSTYAGGSQDNSFEGGGVALRVEQELGGVTLRSITGYRAFAAEADTDSDGQAADFGQARYRDIQNQLSQEFNLLGESADGALQWIAGLYYFTEDADARQRIGIAQPLFVVDNNFGTDTDSYAVFGEANWRFAERFGATLGVRYTTEEKSFYAYAACRPEMFLAPLLCSPQGFYVAPTRAEESWDSVDPRIGLQFRPNDDWLLYASYSTGFKSGGFNARANSPADVEQPYDPEELAAYEIGARGAFGRTTLTAAAFHYDYEDLQITVSGVDQFGASTSVVGNLGAVSIDGVELELVSRLTDSLRVNFNVGLTDASYDSLNEELNAVLTATGNAALSTANDLPRTPEVTGAFGIEHVLGLGWGRLTSRADYSYVDDQFSDVQNFNRTRSPAHHNLNLRFTIEPEAASWSIALYGTNVTDEAYIVNAFWPNGGTGSAVLATPNEPREVGLVLRTEF